jgi:hypothetical protein
MLRHQKEQEIRRPAPAQRSKHVLSRTFPTPLPSSCDPNLKLTVSFQAEATTIGHHYNGDDDSSDDDDERGILVFSSTRQKLLVSA